MRLAFPMGVESQYAFDMSGGQEYFICKIVISNLATTGAGSCAGCSIGVDIDFESYVIYLEGRPDITVTDTATRSHITWQGGVVPTINRTWGAIKGMYR